MKTTTWNNSRYIYLRRRYWQKKQAKILSKYFRDLADKIGSLETDSKSYIRLYVNRIIDEAPLYPILYRAWENIVKDIGTNTYNTIVSQKAFSLFTMGIMGFIQTRVYKRVTRMNTFTKLVIGRMLDEGFEEGASIPDMVKRVRDRFNFMSKKRAQRIARTEVISASNYGSYEGARQTGIELKKFWIAHPESKRTRPTHKRAHGQTVGMNEKFRVGNSWLMIPGDPDGEAKEVINCRCAVGYKEVRK